MTDPRDERVLYKRNHFSTRLPVRYLYSPAHWWLREVGHQSWQIGLTGFATRMLGEIVEFDIERSVGERGSAGEVIGWIEGFKAVSDIYAVVTGSFEGINSRASDDTEIICKDSYDLGWIYAASGDPDGAVLDLDGYTALLDQTIDRMLEKPWQGTELVPPESSARMPESDGQPPHEARPGDGEP